MGVEPTRATEEGFVAEVVVFDLDKRGEQAPEQIPISGSSGELFVRLSEQVGILGERRFIRRCQIFRRSDGKLVASTRGPIYDMEEVRSPKQAPSGPWQMVDDATLPQKPQE